MIQWIKNLMEAKTLESRNRVNEQRAIGKVFEESGFVTERPDSDGFQRIIHPQDREKGHVSGVQNDMIRQARKMYRFDPHARGILQTMLNYIVGKGFDIKPKSQDPQINYIWWEFWNSSRNNMQLKRFEMILRFFRDGDCFIEFFSKGDQGVETGLSTIRFIDPLLVKNPTDNLGSVKGGIEVIRNGVEVDPQDIEQVIAYHAEDRSSPGKFRRAPAETVVHMKALADSDQRRGETFLQTIMPLIAHYNNWLENRIILNRMRTAIVMIKKITGTSTELNQLRGNMGPQNVSGQTVIQAGKMLIANDGVDYRMESPNINAADVKDDGRNIKLAMSAGTNLPEYIFGDASNGNFASTLIAEAPFVKSIEYWQIIIEMYLKQIYRKVMENAVKSGRIKPPNDEEFFRTMFKTGKLTEAQDEDKDDEVKNEMKDDTGNSTEPPSEIFFGCDIQWPEIIHRDLKMHTDALMVARSNGWISDSTAASSLGYDYDEEVRKQQKIIENAQEFDNPLLSGGMKEPSAFDEGDMDREAEDVLKDKNGNNIDDESPPSEKQFAGKAGGKNGNKAE